MVKRETPFNSSFRKREKIGFRSGQSLIEVVFSVGVIVLVMTAVLSLLVSSLKSRTQGLDRGKAAELGQKVIEQLVEMESADGDNFWNINSSYWRSNNGVTKTMSGYPGYNYTVGFTQVTNVCPGTATNFVCANVTVGVGWTARTPQSVVFTRFFSRQ